MSQTENKSNNILSMVILISGLYVSFVISGIYEEKLYKGKYTDSEGKSFKFSQPSLALFLTSVLSFIISVIALKTM